MQRTADVQHDQVINKDRIGVENRTAITTTLTQPSSTVALIVFHLPSMASNERGRCTGTMVGKDAVLTNGHCVFDVAKQKFADMMTVIPGAYQDPAVANQYKAPWGTSSGKGLFAHDDYRLGIGDKQRGSDIGMVRLKVALGTSSGTRTVIANDNPTGNIDYLGYQGDLVRNRMHFSPGKVTGWYAQSFGVFKTDADAAHGASGSGLSASKNILQIFGIMQGGQGSDFNLGIAFSAAKRDKIKAWTALTI